MGGRIVAGAAVGVAVLLGGGVLAGCGSVNRAFDCARTAASIAGDVQDLQNSATNIGQVSDPSRRQATVSALDRMQGDLTRLGNRTDDDDVRRAVDELGTAVRGARASAAQGQTPDLRPVGSAASHLTGVCAPG